jgi:hypothetical protein
MLQNSSLPFSADVADNNVLIALVPKQFVHKIGHILLLQTFGSRVVSDLFL